MHSNCDCKDIKHTSLSCSADLIVFSSLSFYYDLDMSLATRDALVINKRSRFSKISSLVWPN